MEKVVYVVAGVLKRGNTILLTSRPASKSHAGYWEFPGGKLECNESAIDALIRELREEINVVVNDNDCEMLTHITQRYADKTVELDVVVVRKWSGGIVALEGQDVHFHDLGGECAKEPLLPTTQKILDLLMRK